MSLTMPQVYADSRLDRAARRRRDRAWLAQAWARADGRVVAVWQGHTLIAGLEHDRPQAILLDAAQATQLADQAERTAVFLGVEEDAPARPWFALDIGLLSDAEAGRMAQALGGAWTDLRRAGGLLPAATAARLAYARGMIHWHAGHRHCGWCGTATLSAEGGFVGQCAPPGCGRQHHPRTDPAVIMAVEAAGDATTPPRLLLARDPRWPPGMHSVLAGFVEPGESLEEAVRREVAEEVQIPVGAVRYAASQPWPFPQSLMIGFYAEALGTQIVPDPDEIESAQWVTAAELHQWGAPDRPDGAPRLPRADSIARRLIAAWLATQQEPGR